jgi:hypothetical protein
MHELYKIVCSYFYANKSFRVGNHIKTPNIRLNVVKQFKLSMVTLV